MAAALIKQDDPVARRIMALAQKWRNPAPRPAVQHHNRHALGVAALFNIDAMALPNVDHPLIEGFDRRVKIV